jgi:arylsulfatase A-like enzyme
VVFQNAFTRYGGTGLSEPSIWSGAMLLHKQYTTPFAPMNTLQKLLRAESYRTYLSRDSVLRVILAPDPDIVDLDPPDSTMTYHLDGSLGKLEEQIDRRPAESPPIFAYTQPQSIHISVIRREGSSVPPGESYPGFYAPYASRVKRLDAAFGQFVDFLKSRGLYEDSLIVLTADHGDSLGEEGRWGHAYTIFPEIVRIPLIVHLPPWLSETVTASPESLAFLTDITPSLYYLLGHPPSVTNELAGVPLFTRTPGERTRDQHGSFLVASSYAPVYGILSHQGKQLFVADAVNYKNYLFEMRGEQAAPATVGESFKREQEALIKQALLSIGRFYGYSDDRGEKR